MLSVIPAREWTFEISDGAAEPTFIEIGGLDNFGWDRQTASEETDDFSSQGQGASLPMRRASTIALSGHRLEDPDTGDRDPGQEEIETSAELIGAAAVRDFQVTTPGGKVGTFVGWAEMGSTGGGKNNKTGWAATLHINGRIVWDA
ncbi:MULTISPECIES: phage tail tube protein [unclassified Egicoccus]|uniref:phage tail tube protein n=1 Tax=unclassified Egicoccus TaxID=2635606 RepID=UPI00359E1294